MPPKLVKKLPTKKPAIFAACAVTTSQKVCFMLVGPTFFLENAPTIVNALCAVIGKFIYLIMNEHEQDFSFIYVW